MSDKIDKFKVVALVTLVVGFIGFTGAAFVVIVVSSVEAYSGITFKDYIISIIQVFVSLIIITFSVLLYKGYDIGRRSLLIIFLLLMIYLVIDSIIILLDGGAKGMLISLFVFELLPVSIIFVLLLKLNVVTKMPVN